MKKQQQKKKEEKVFLGNHTSGKKAEIDEISKIFKGVPSSRVKDIKVMKKETIMNIVKKYRNKGLDEASYQKYFDADVKHIAEEIKEKEYRKQSIDKWIK